MDATTQFKTICRYEKFIPCIDELINLYEKEIEEKRYIFDSTCPLCQKARIIYNENLKNITTETICNFCIYSENPCTSQKTYLNKNQRSFYYKKNIFHFTHNRINKLKRLLILLKKANVISINDFIKKM